jgi:hypothetical protein
MILLLPVEAIDLARRTRFGGIGGICAIAE